MNKEKVLRDIEATLFGKTPGWVEVGQNELEKIRAAMVRLFDPDYNLRGVAALKDFQEAYVRLTGDKTLQFTRASFYPENVSEGLRSCMSFNSSSFTYALQNALSMYLSKIYKSLPYHEDILISDKKKADDFRTVHSVQLGYFGDLPDVDPETADYEEMEKYDDTETQYDISQKGTVIQVTRKHVLNNSIGLIQAMIDRIARAARKAHARYVWNFYINNSNCPDGTAWFTSGHGNLGSNALDFDPLVTAITALANMTEPSPSNEKIGMDLTDFQWWLVVPIALWDLAIKKNQAKSYYTANDLTTKVPNPCYRLFGDHNERIAVVPFLADANDWGIIRDKEDVPIVEMSYLGGKEEPEFIIAEEEMNERMLKSDMLGYKARHEYGGNIANYRGGYKSEV